jgi:hypothetical protein
LSWFGLSKHVGDEQAQLKGDFLADGTGPTDQATLADGVLRILKKTVLKPCPVFYNSTIMQFMLRWESTPLNRE